MNLNRETSLPEWQTLFAGEWQQGWMHSGIAQLRDGRLVFEAPGGKALIYLEAETGQCEKVSVDIAAAHHILPVWDGHEESIWICDPGAEPPGQVLRVNLGGQNLENIPQPLGDPAENGKWRPTAMTISNNGDKWIADGYGLSLIHVIRTDGRVETFNGGDSGKVFNCPHGITITERNGVPIIAVADRSNKRVVYLSESGEYIKEVSGTVMTSPSSLINYEGTLYVTDLFSSVLEIDKLDNLRAVISSEPINTQEGWPNQLHNGETVGPTLLSGKMNSPHGITVNRDGKINFTDWCLGGRVVQLTQPN